MNNKWALRTPKLYKGKRSVIQTRLIKFLDKIALRFALLA